MNRIDLIIMGATAGFLAAIAYEMYQFNKPKYIPAIEADDQLQVDPYLLELLEKAIQGHASPA